MRSGTSKGSATASPAPDLGGKTVIVTGANTGIGRETARELAGRGARVFLACRSEEKARPVIDQLTMETGSGPVQFLPLDLGDLGAVRDCAATFLARDEPLHILINNAGVAGQRGLTPSGFEMAFGTNHVGPFLLTSLLIERLRASAPARIVNVSSEAHHSAPGVDFAAVRSPTRSLTGMREYAVSKLANVLHVIELARRLEGSGVTAYALHPGVIGSDIWRRVPWPARAIMKMTMRPTTEGARTPVYCATSPDVSDDSGHYYEKCRRTDPSATATPQLAAELWEHSEDWVRAR